MGKTAFEEVFLANPAKDGNKLANHFPLHGPANIAINSKKMPKKTPDAPYPNIHCSNRRSLTSITCEGERLS